MRESTTVEDAKKATQRMSGITERGRPTCTTSENGCAAINTLGWPIKIKNTGGCMSPIGKSD
jgi:hypothetical protein